VVLASLAVAVWAALSPGDLDAGRLWPPMTGSPRDILGAAGVLFFAFAGYARIATLGEEVREPARTIPRAIVLALGMVLVLYATIAVALLVAIDPGALAAADAPLAFAAERSGRWPVTVVRAGAAVASLGSLLSLVVGVSRTAFAMAAEGDLPRQLAAVHPRYRVPHRAELCAGAIVAVAAALADVRAAIGFSSFAVLAYYAIANASAFTLRPDERRWPRWLSVAGLIGCAAIAISLPIRSTVAGAALLALGALVYGVRRAPARS
jgi:APA family basic amino acid/polyamine antiporter